MHAADFRQSLQGKGSRDAAVAIWNTLGGAQRGKELEIADHMPAVGVTSCDCTV